MRTDRRYSCGGVGRSSVARSTAGSASGGNAIERGEQVPRRGSENSSRILGCHRQPPARRPFEQSTRRKGGSTSATFPTAAIYTGVRMREHFSHSPKKSQNAILHFGRGLFHMSFLNQQIGLPNGLLGSKNPRGTYRSVASRQVSLGCSL